MNTLPHIVIPYAFLQLGTSRLLKELSSKDKAGGPAGSEPPVTLVQYTDELIKSYCRCGFAGALYCVCKPAPYKLLQMLRFRGLNCAFGSIQSAVVLTLWTAGSAMPGPGVPRGIAQM